MLATDCFAQEEATSGNLSHAKAQSRKGLPGFWKVSLRLCAFALDRFSYSRRLETT